MSHFSREPCSPASVPLTLPSRNRFADEDVICNGKRKRPSENDFTPLFEPFVAETVDGALISLIPYIRLSRAALPLSYLAYGSCPVGRDAPIFFTATCTNLCESIQPQSQDGGSVVIIAREEDVAQCFVVEQVRPQAFVLCPLAPWIGLTSLTKLSIPHEQGRQFADGSRISEQAQDHWWAGSVLSLENDNAPLEATELDLDAPVDEDMPTADVPNDSKVTDQGRHASESIKTPQFSDDATHAFDLDLHPQLTFEQVCCAIVEQYLDILYKSTASLAYFAKGPLSRARASIALSPSGDTKLDGLAAAMRLMVHDPSKLDKKYRLKLPELLTTIGSEQQSNGTSKAKRTKKLKRAAPGKDGLYNIERDYVRAWYSNAGPTTNPASGQKPWKNPLLSLQFREYLLQIILVLEVMAIEASLLKDQPEPVGPNASTDLEARTKSEKGNKKSKLEHDLEGVLAGLVDKISIWQSVGLDQAPSEEARQLGETRPENAPDGREKGIDRIGEFYSDVLIPFFSARLPKKIKALTKSLGVSIRKSPEKARLHTHPSGKDSKLVQPGTRVRRVHPQQRRKPLARVQTEGMDQALSRPPALLRSLTESKLHEVKREDRLTPQDAVLKPARNALSRANSVKFTRRSSHREIDMTMISKFHDIKVRRKTATEQEIKDAIAVMKKPNRNLAVKENVRSTDSGTKNPPIVHSARQRHGVEIGVTPRKGSRLQDFYNHDSFNSVQLVPSNSAEHIPSTNPLVPSSTTKPRRASAVTPLAGSKSRPSAHATAIPFETPSRGPKKIDVYLYPSSINTTIDSNDDVVPHSQVKSRHVRPVVQPEETVQIDLSNRKCDTHHLAPSREDVARSDESMPTKGTPQDCDGLLLTAAKASACGSIYETLGWMGNDIDELM